MTQFASDLMSTVIRIGDLGVQHGSQHLRQTGGRLRDECLLSARPPRALLVSHDVPERSRSGVFSRSSKETLGDDVALDFVGAHIDLEGLGIAHVLLYRILLDIAIASENLHGFCGDLHSDVRGVALADR